MSNMSYCRFRNTLNDLDDCTEYMTETVSEEETRARKRLLKICKEIAEYDEDDLPEAEKFGDELTA